MGFKDFLNIWNKAADDAQAAKTAEENKNNGTSSTASTSASLSELECEMISKHISDAYDILEKTDSSYVLYEYRPGEKEQLMQFADEAKKKIDSQSIDRTTFVGLSGKLGALLETIQAENERQQEELKAKYDSEVFSSNEGFYRDSIYSVVRNLCNEIAEGNRISNKKGAYADLTLSDEKMAELSQTISDAEQLIEETLKDKQGSGQNAECFGRLSDLNSRFGSLISDIQFNYSNSKAQL